MSWLAFVKPALPLIAVAALNACAMLEQVQRVPPVEVIDAKGVEPAVVVEPVRNNGAIFQGDRYRPLFEDHRARLVGDTITVLITEKAASPTPASSPGCRTACSSRSAAAPPPTPCCATAWPPR